MDDLESLWDRLLSRQPEQIRAAYVSLAAAEQLEVRRHLERMVSEAGWHPEQRRSAEVALLALDAR